MSDVLHEERFICISISRFISLIFLSASFVLNKIQCLYQLFRVFENSMSSLGASDFGGLPVFRK